MIIHYSDTCTVLTTKRHVYDTLLSGPEPCAPWVDFGFFNPVTEEEGLRVSFIRHWSWKPNEKKVYFNIPIPDVHSKTTEERNAAVTAARDTVNAMFDNIGGDEPLPIEVRALTTGLSAEVPSDYVPANDVNAFTFIYGQGESFATHGTGSTPGRGRRRFGSTSQGGMFHYRSVNILLWLFIVYYSHPCILSLVGSRDFTVFTINWYSSGAKLEAGSTYSSRSFYLASNLGDVKPTSDTLRGQTNAFKIGSQEYNPRSVDLYTIGNNFMVVAAESSEGASTSW